MISGFLFKEQFVKLKENTSPLDWGGVLGREAFFWMQFKLFIICGFLGSISYLIFLDGQRRNSVASVFTGIAIAFVVGLGCAILSFMAIWKRIRDIRGTTEHEGWAILIFFCFVFSCINDVAAGIYGVPFWFFVYLKKGVVTSPEAIRLQEIYDRLVRVFRS